MELQVHGMKTADTLADALFSQPEPWRSRFLAFLAERATRWAWDGKQPTRQEVAVWLADSALFEVMSLMLYRWSGAQNQIEGSLHVH
jgi:hypothetical protein